jgi:hypothetical protein
MFSSLFVSSKREQWRSEKEAARSGLLPGPGVDDWGQGMIV